MFASSTGTRFLAFVPSVFVSALLLAVAIVPAMPGLQLGMI